MGNSGGVTVNRLSVWGKNSNQRPVHRLTPLTQVNFLALAL